MIIPENLIENTLEDRMYKCPFIFEWCEYKGETYFAALDYEKSIKSNRVVLNLHYCATAALNNSILIKTVTYIPSKFQYIQNGK